MASRQRNLTGLLRYSQWDGSQKRSRNSAEDLLGAIADDVLQFGNIQYALQRLIGAGVGSDGLSQFQSLSDILQQVLNKRRQQLQRYNINSVFDDLKQELQEILQMELDRIEQWMQGNISAEDKDAQAQHADTSSFKFTDEVFIAIAQGQKELLLAMPAEFSKKIEALQKYDFINPDAQKRFLQLLQKLRDIVSQNFFKDMKNMVDSLSGGDMERMKSMVQALSEMLVQHMQGEDADFDSFMREYGDMFGENPPQDLQQLLDQIQQQMANMQALMNSLSPQQRQELENLMADKLGDSELQSALMRLSKELSFLNPNQQGFNFQGGETIDLEQALKIMDELNKLEQLEGQIRDVRDFSDLDNIDEKLIDEFLGEEVAEGFEELREAIEKLEEAGYIKKEDGKWDMTSRGSRVIGQKALGEIYQQLKNQGLGHHKTNHEGRFGDRQEETKDYEFGDAFNLHIPRTVRNAIQRNIVDDIHSRESVRLKAEDFEIYKNELNTRTATVLLLDLSLSMEMRGSFLSAKKVTVALHNLISTRFPRDSLDVIGFSAVAKELNTRDLLKLEVDQFSLGTNMQHALDLAMKKLSKHHSGSKQIIMISDGEPTSHIQRGKPFFSYPPHPKTIYETLKAVKRCTQKDIAINTFMLEQSPSLMQFMNQLAKINGGRVFYTSPEKLGEYILHDYVENKRKKLSRGTN